ncbi:diguanylate cyclase [Paenibacillus sp. SI8]|uniref:sensor domain-containing diguanylate cyclase n=1 Tax=unclassified Paenibacillus TaxID=185978 RepID=UPI0034678383
MRRGIHSYFSNQTIMQRFRFLIGGVIAALGISIIVPFYITEKHERLNEVENQLKQVVALQSLYIERRSQEKLDTIKRFANSGDARRHRISELNAEIAVYKTTHAEFENIFYVDSDGYIRSEDNPSVVLYVGDRSYFRQAAKTMSDISGVLITKITGKQMIAFSSPVLGDQNEFEGVIVGLVPLEMLDKQIEELNFGKTGEVFVLDMNGDIVTASKSRTEVNMKMCTDIVQRAKANVNSNESYIGFHGKKVYGQFIRSSGNGWIIVAEISESEVFQKLNELSLTIILITLIALVLSFFAVISITARIERPIRYLLRGTKIIQSGNYDFQIDCDNIKLAPVELRQLCNTFNLMSSKLKTNMELLEHSALVDQLTQIHNRRYIMAEGSCRLQVCIDAGHPCTVMMLDIDYFKRINDTHGHLVGDRVLHRVATILSEHAGEDTLVARYGGEEFILLALYKDAEQSESLAEALRIRLMKESNEDENEQVKIPVTVSIGLAEYVPHRLYGTTVLEDMVYRADQALYQAKSKGRNRVELDR